MKEKKRGNWYDKHKKGLSVILFLVIWISSCIGMFVLMGGMQVWDSYDEKAYNQLIEAADAVVSNESLDLRKRPEGIECTVNTDENITTVTFFYKGQEYGNEAPCVIVRLREQSHADGYDKISQVRNYSSKNEFLQRTVPGYIAGAVLVGSISAEILCTIVLCIIEFIVNKAKKQ